MAKLKNPLPTVDIIIEIPRRDGRTGFILIKRKNPPPGWALPGGFVEYGESLEEAAVREAKEETSLDIELVSQFHTYSAPGRDPRFHTISTVYIARTEGLPRAQDDAQEIGIFLPEDRPHPLAFDHDKILADYFQAGPVNSGKTAEDEGETSKSCYNSIDSRLTEEKTVDVKLRELRRVWGLSEAEVIKSLLASHGIGCIFRGEMVQAVYPITVDGLGEIKIMVAESDYELARDILENSLIQEK